MWVDFFFKKKKKLIFIRLFSKQIASGERKNSTEETIVLFCERRLEKFSMLIFYSLYRMQKITKKEGEKDCFPPLFLRN